MELLIRFGVVVVSGLYTSLWGAFKDGPYEGFKPATFPRSVWFHVVIFLCLWQLPVLSDRFARLGLVQVFFVAMGVERYLAEIYKGFFRTEDQAKYFVPSRITFLGRYVASDLLRYAAGAVMVAGAFLLLTVGTPVTHVLAFAGTAYATGLLVSLGGAYKDAPFEGFKPLKFQRSAVVLAVCTPVFYFLNDPGAPVPLGFLVFMNAGLERFVVEYYKTYIQRTMSGKFRPDLQRIQQVLDTRERFHYAALAIIAGVCILYAYDVWTL